MSIVICSCCDRQIDTDFHADDVTQIDGKDMCFDCADELIAAEDAAANAYANSQFGVGA